MYIRTTTCAMNLSELTRGSVPIIKVIERAHTLFMSIEISDIILYIIGIYVRVVRVWCPVFPVYSGSSIENNTYSILGISGNFTVCGSSRFQSRLLFYLSKLTIIQCQSTV